MHTFVEFDLIRSLSEVPLFYPALQHSTLDWEFETEPSDRYCLAMQDGICGWPRGKVLGGSSVLNAMMYVVIVQNLSTIIRQQQ